MLENGVASFIMDVREGVNQVNGRIAGETIILNDGT